ncbi:hypothetical protein ISS96_02375 [Candidatus Bathyarchaeota archaeon]|nr:hypothetical protein [Candidatus Bathyarchaeota archaeon]
MVAKERTIISDLPTIIGVIGLFWVATLYWTDPAWGPALILRNATTLSLPFATIITVGLLIRRHLQNIARGEETIPYDVVTIVSAVGMVLLGLVGGMGDPTMATLYANVNVIGTMAVISAIAISVFSPMIRIYRAKTPVMGLLIFLSILAFFTYTPLGEMISPVIPAAGDFVQTYISGASDSAFWISTYIGAVALITRMMLLKERLRP